MRHVSHFFLARALPRLLLVSLVFLLQSLFVCRLYHSFYAFKLVKTKHFFVAVISWVFVGSMAMSLAISLFSWLHCCFVQSTFCAAYMTTLLASMAILLLARLLILVVKLHQYFFRLDLLFGYGSKRWYPDGSPKMLVNRWVFPQIWVWLKIGYIPNEIVIW